MRRSKSFMKKTRRNKVLKVVREHYLRDDIWCGCKECKLCGPYPQGQHGPRIRLKNNRFLLVVDTNVVLHQIDVLEHADFGRSTSLILCQTTMEETKHRDARVYKRVKERILQDETRSVVEFANEHHRSTYAERQANESPNDRNDRMIRKVASWYHTHLTSQDHLQAGDFGCAKVVFLTNDAENLSRAKTEGLDAMTVNDFVKAHLGQEFPHLVELLAHRHEIAQKGHTETGFVAYWPEERLQAAVQAETVVKAKINMRRGGGYDKTATIMAAGFDRPIQIKGADINRAIDGDSVFVEITDRGSHEGSSSSSGKGDEKSTAPQGRVVGIAQRNWRPYCGSLEETDKERGSVLFMPVDARIPKVRMQTSQAQALMDQRIVVCIDSWAVDSRFPSGHYVKTLGKIGEVDTETAVLLQEHDIRTSEWSNAVLACLPLDEPPSEDEIRGRVDLRNVDICSVDPPGCTDIDDALHCQMLPNGNFEVGVHIADVTHYLQPDTALDDEAALRATSVYLVQRRIDMLPQLLSTNMCSLHANVMRLAFSVVWEMTPDAQIVDTRFHRSVIKSRAAFAYQEAQDRIDAKIGWENGEPTEWAAKSICNLNRLAKKLRARRMEDGALSLASTQMKFTLDSDKDPTGCKVYEIKDANRMVEDWMLLANVSVAKQILQHFPTQALLRRHPRPQPSSFEHLIQVAQVMGFSLETESSKLLADSLDKMKIDDFPEFNTLMRIQTTRCMSQALYFSSGDHETEEYHHYGLASAIYTHFTSPIRRYADVIVHRLLANSIGIAALPKSIEDKERMRKVAENINHRHRMAQLCGRSSSDLFTLVYFRDKITVEEGVITDITPTGVQVMVLKYGIEQQINLVSRDDDKAGNNPYSFDADNLTLSKGDVRFKIFDRVRVRIYVWTTRHHRQNLIIELVDDRISPLRHKFNPGPPKDAKDLSGDAPAAAKRKRVETTESMMDDAKTLLD